MEATYVNVVVYNVGSGVETTLCLSQPLPVLNRFPVYHTYLHSLATPIHNHPYPLHLPPLTSANPRCNHRSINTPAISRPACLFCSTTDQTWVVSTALVDRLFLPFIAFKFVLLHPNLLLPPRFSLFFLLSLLL